MALVASAPLRSGDRIQISSLKKSWGLHISTYRQGCELPSASGQDYLVDGSKILPHVPTGVTVSLPKPSTSLDLIMPCRPFSLKLHPVSGLFKSTGPALSWRGVFSGKRCTISQVLPQLGSPSQISTYFKYQSQPTSTSLPRGQDNSFWAPGISVVNMNAEFYSRKKKPFLLYFFVSPHPQPNRQLLLKSQQASWPS